MSHRPIRKSAGFSANPWHTLCSKGWSDRMEIEYEASKTNEAKRPDEG
jgi:hypothetical protein